MLDDNTCIEILYKIWILPKNGQKSLHAECIIYNFFNCV